MPLVGKGELTKELINRGYKQVVMSNGIKDEMHKQNIEVTHENIRNFATDIRKDRGRGVAAELAIPAIKKLAKSEDVIVIDGIRSPEEIDIFKEKYGKDFILISVNASFKVCLSRLKKRSKTRKDDPVDEAGLKWRNKEELSWGLAETISKADYQIVNEGTLEEFKQKIGKILSKVLPQ